MVLESEIRFFASNIISRSFNGFCKLDGILFRCPDKNPDNVTMVYKNEEVKLIDLLELTFGGNIYSEMYSILEEIIKSRITYVD